MIRILIACLCISPTYASAAVLISEIMYDLSEGSDTGREWIEVYNDAESVNLATWKLLENGKVHAIEPEGDTVLPAGAYAVIADNAEKFLADWPVFSGALYDSSFRLNNSGETLSLVDSSGNENDPVTFTKSLGGNGTGESLQRDGDGFAPGTPTPGRGNTTHRVEPSSNAPEREKAASRPGSVIQKSADAGQSAQIASAAPAAPQFTWWVAPLLLALIASGGIVWSRHLKKDEWEILEEDGEKS